MRIGIDCRMFSSAFTGIGRYVSELVSSIERTETPHEYVLFFNEPHYTEYTPTSPRIRQVLVNARHYGLHEQTTFLHALYRERLDLMHFTHFNAPIGYRRPCIVTIHDLTLSFYPGKRMTGWIHRLAYSMTIRSVTQRADAIIAVSRHTKKDLVELLNIPEEKIRVIPNGLNREEFVRTAETEEYSRLARSVHHLNRPYLLYTGVQREHKNLVRLIDAYARVLRDHPDYPYDLVLAGKEDANYPDLRNHITESGIQKRVRILGFVDSYDLIGLYLAASAYVFPSLYEGFGLPILEAMACGIPVACSEMSSLPEVAGEGNALFFNPMSIDSMSQALIRITEDTRFREQLIARGYERIKDFSWEKTCREIVNVYESFGSRETVRVG